MARGTKLRRSISVNTCIVQHLDNSHERSVCRPFVPSPAKERLHMPLKQRRPRRIAYDKKRSSLPVPEGSALRAGRVSNSFTSA